MSFLSNSTDHVQKPLSLSLYLVNVGIQTDGNSNKKITFIIEEHNNDSTEIVNPKPITSKPNRSKPSRSKPNRSKTTTSEPSTPEPSTPEPSEDDATTLSPDDSSDNSTNDSSDDSTNDSGDDSTNDSSDTSTEATPPPSNPRCVRNPRLRIRTSCRSEKYCKRTEQGNWELVRFTCRVGFVDIRRKCYSRRKIRGRIVLGTLNC